MNLSSSQSCPISPRGVRITSMKPQKTENPCGRRLRACRANQFALGRFPDRAERSSQWETSLLHGKVVSGTATRPIAGRVYLNRSPFPAASTSQSPQLVERTQYDRSGTARGAESNPAKRFPRSQTQPGRPPSGRTKGFSAPATRFHRPGRPGGHRHWIQAKASSILLLAARGNNRHNACQIQSRAGPAAQRFPHVEDKRLMR